MLITENKMFELFSFISDSETQKSINMKGYLSLSVFSQLSARRYDRILFRLPRMMKLGNNCRQVSPLSEMMQISMKMILAEYALNPAACSNAYLTQAKLRLVYVTTN